MVEDRRIDQIDLSGERRKSQLSVEEERRKSERRKAQRREFPRFRIEQMIEISFGRETYLQAAGVNISQTGLLCQTGEPVEPQARLFILIRLQGEDDKGQEIKCEGIVVRSDKKGDRFDVGVSFTDMQSGDKEKIKAFLAKVDA